MMSSSRHLSRLFSTATTATVRRVRKAPLQLTDAAVARLKELLTRNPEKQPLGIRLGVRERGCSGNSYTMNYVLDSPPKLDEVVEEKGVRVYIDPKALMLVIGTTMDWKETPTSSEFVFNNPNAKGTCGCGESFNV